MPLIHLLRYRSAAAFTATALERDWVNYDEVAKFGQSFTVIYI
jgi:hypothetical protein